MLVRPLDARRLRAAWLAAAALSAAALLALGGGGSARAAAPACPSFKVLHDDRIGAASLPAGEYAITVSPDSALTCKQASALFAEFLEDYDGKLPGGWRIAPRGSGKAAFSRAADAGFSVARTGGEEGGNNPLIGKLCPQPYTVNASGPVGSLYFPRGKYLLYQPAGTGISCNRAAVLFTRFLAQPAGILPTPWRLETQTGTFYKPANRVRSAFRVEPFSGT